MDYGCEVTNRYIGYLDSSDHGNDMTSSSAHNKRKNKKKRKPKHGKFVDKCINTEPSSEATKNDDEHVMKNQDPSPSNVSQSLPTDTDCDAATSENQASESNEGKNQGKNNEIKMQTTECIPNSAPSIGPSNPSDASHDQAKDHQTDKNSSSKTTAPDDGFNTTGTKWSEICFEEEKSLMVQNDPKSNDDVTKQTVNDPELVFSEHRVYPTLYFYNSNFGNRNRRTVEWFDLEQRHRNSYNNSYNNDEPIERANEERKKKRQKPGRRKKYTSTGTDDNNIDDTNSADEKYVDSYNQFNDHASQHTNDSNYREFINTQFVRFNQFKHGATRFHSERTYTRRRSDIVRNV